jgi:hypothetical protein
LDSLEITESDALARRALQRTFYRRQRFGCGDGRGHIILLLRAITESEGNDDALIERIIGGSTELRIAQAFRWPAGASGCTSVGGLRYQAWGAMRGAAHRLCQEFGVRLVAKAPGEMETASAAIIEHLIKKHGSDAMVLTMRVLTETRQANRLQLNRVVITAVNTVCRLRH